MTKVGMTIDGVEVCIRQFAEISNVLLKGNNPWIILDTGGGILARAAKGYAAAHGNRREYFGSKALERNIIVKHLAKKHADIRGIVIGARSKKIPIRQKSNGRWTTIGKKKASEMKAAGEKVKYANPAKYAHLVEFGTGPRAPLRKKAMWTPWGPRKRTQGSRAKPFMRPAFDAMSHIANERMMAKANQLIFANVRNTYQAFATKGVVG